MLSEVGGDKPHEIMQAWVGAPEPPPRNGTNLAYPDGHERTNGNGVHTSKDVESVMSIAGPPLLKQPDHYSTYSTVVFENAGKPSTNGVLGGDRDLSGKSRIKWTLSPWLRAAGRDEGLSW